MVCTTLSVTSLLLFYLGMDQWYGALQKPFFGLPIKMLAPFHAFAIFISGFGVQIVMANVSGNPAVRPARRYFGIWLFCHALWLLVFAAFHHALFGLVLGIIQWGVAVFSTQKFFNVDPSAGRKVLFFLFMTTYWMLLNVGILSLNNI